MALGMTAFFGINVVYPAVAADRRELHRVVGRLCDRAGRHPRVPDGADHRAQHPAAGAALGGHVLVLVFAATSYWFSTFPLDTSFWQFVLPRFLMGLAIPCFFIPLNQVILSGLKPHEIASASGLSNFFRTIAASDFDRRDRHDVAAPRRFPSRDARRARHHAESGDASVPRWPRQARRRRAAAPWAMIERIVNREALTLAVNDVFLLYAALFVVMIPIVWLARAAVRQRRRRPRRTDSTARRRLDDRRTRRRRLSGAVLSLVTRGHADVRGGSRAARRNGTPATPPAASAARFTTR